jgi:RimJ/RimL family protein N-acetyltransferase
MRSSKSKNIHKLTTQAPLRLTTEIPGVILRDLLPADASAWIDLVDRNRAHLSEFGDDTLPPHTLEDVNRWLSSSSDMDLRMGIWRDSELMGFVELSHLSYAIGGEALLSKSPNGWVLGYWIGTDYIRKGFTTAACRSLMKYARSKLNVKEFWSGARNGNVASMAVLERLGFTMYKQGPDSVGYRLSGYLE